MSKYYISNGRLVEVRDDELMHIAVSKLKPRDDHKYISREWKNGKWVYTYKDDSKGSTKQSTPKNSTKKVSSEYEAEVAYNSQKNNYFGKTSTPAVSKSSAASKINAGKDAATKVLSSKVKSGIDAAKNAAQTAAPKSAKKMFSEYEAEVAYNSQKNQYPTSSANTKKTEDKKTGWDKLVDSFKDWLGYDERDRLQEAEKTEANAKQKLDNALDKQDEAFIKYFLEEDPAKKSEAEKEYDKALDETIKLGNEWSDAMEDTRNAQFEYNDSMLKKSEDVKRFVSNSLEDLADAVESVLKFPGVAAAAIGDKIEDVASDIEYTASRNLGVAQKKNYEAAKKNLVEAKRNLQNASGITATYQAEFRLKQAEEAYENARKAYSGTPLDTIETGRDYVKNWLEDLFD